MFDELAGYVVARLRSERPGLLEHVLALRTPLLMSDTPEASCGRAPEGGLLGQQADPGFPRIRYC